MRETERPAIATRPLPLVAAIGGVGPGGWFSECVGVVGWLGGLVAGWQGSVGAIEAERCRAREKALQDGDRHVRSPVKTKGMSALQFYHKHVYQRERSRGYRGRAANSQLWAMVREEWSRLTDDDPLKILATRQADESRATVQAAKVTVLQPILATAQANEAPPLPPPPLPPPTSTQDELMEYTSGGSIGIGEFPLHRDFCCKEHLVDGDFVKTFRQWRQVSSKCPTVQD